MTQRLRRRQPLHLVHAEQAVEKRPGLRRHRHRGLVIVPATDATERGELVVLVEGQLGAQHRVQDDTRGPHVHGGGVGLTADHLGSDVGGSAALIRHLGPRRLHLLRQAKVRDAQRLEVVPSGEDYVLELQVPVRDGPVVDVAHALEELLHDPRGVALLHAPVLHQHVEQVAALEKFHDHVHVVARLVKVVHLHRVFGFVHADGDADLLGDLFQAHGVAARPRSALPARVLVAADVRGDVHDLDRVSASRSAVRRELHDGETARAQGLLQGEISHDRGDDPARRGIPQRWALRERLVGKVAGSDALERLGRLCGSKG